MNIPNSSSIIAVLQSAIHTIQINSPANTIIVILQNAINIDVLRK